MTKIKELEKFLTSLEETPYEVKVFTFDADGIRIAEISYVHRRSSGVFGASYMRSEPECAAIILAAENFLIYEDEEELEEVKGILKYLIGR